MLGIAGVDGNGQLELSGGHYGSVADPIGEASITGAKRLQNADPKTDRTGICPYSGGANDTGTGRPNFSASENMIINCYDRPPITKNHLFNSRQVKENGKSW